MTPLSIDTSKPWVFGFELVYAPQNSVSLNKDDK